jgi:hypothetical protein
MSRLGFALFTAAALSFGFVGATRAADMPTKAPPLRGCGFGPWLDWFLSRRQPRWSVDDARCGVESAAITGRLHCLPRDRTFGFKPLRRWRAIASGFPAFPSGLLWHNTSVQEARLRLSYKFDWNVPAAGQYWAHD